MKEFHTVDLGTGKSFKSMKSLRRFISNNLPNIPDVEKPDICSVEIGYVEPGHGMKGKKVWLFTDGDLLNMYAKHESKRSIRLWCYTTKTKKDNTKKGAKEEQNKSEVDEIYEKLQKRHKGTYTPEQLRAWSHMVHLKTHDSLEEPPDKPFFRGRKRQSCTGREGSTPDSKRAAVSTGVSPGRKVNIRSELINQLDKWHRLLDSGVVSKEEYDELKGKILSDIKEL